MPADRQFVVDDRVPFALNAVPIEERSRIEALIRDGESFRRAVECGTVRRLRTEQPLYSLRITPELRLIYRQRGDSIELLDIMNRAWIGPSEAEAGAGDESPSIDAGCDVGAASQ